jgi:NAD(P)H-flavin reductase
MAPEHTDEKQPDTAPPGSPTEAPEPPGYPLELLTSWDETPTLRGLRLRVPRALGSGYRVPGQYLELSHPRHGRGYFALAAAPPDPHDPETVLELLVRRGSPLPDALAELAPGPTAVRAAAVLGSGFPIDDGTHPLLLVASGSGIAPLRAVLQQRTREGGSLRHVALYYGERSEADLAYRGEIEALRERGLQLELVLSRPAAQWSGATGRVQSRLFGSPPPWLGPSTVALLCGQPEMITETSTRLAERGVPASRIRVNY